MKTLLIPIDSTSASENAVSFAAEWSRKYLYERIILLKSFYTSMYENVIIGGEFANVDQGYLNRIRENKKENLEIWRKYLDEKTGEGILVQSFTTELPLLRSIIQIVKSEQPEMILLGSDKINSSNAALVSGNVISIAKISPVRVLIVPVNYIYQPIERALVPCDFNAIDTLKKINRLRSSHSWQDVQLLVLNIVAKDRNIDPDEKFRNVEESLHDYLKNFKHDLHYAADKDIINGILNFKRISEVQLMIALPGRYSFLYSLTHKNISEALYRNATLPVMILK